jgi:uncharacterized protein
MRIAVISDTHDRLDYTARAIERMRGLGVELVLHCGDIEEPETASLFGEIPTHFVFGNWDRRAAPLLEAIQSAGGTFYPGWGYLEVAGKKLAWCHSHVWGELAELESLNEFDFLFYGHTHQAESHRTGKTLVVNPGAMFRAKRKTFALVNVLTSEVEWVEVSLGGV